MAMSLNSLKSRSAASPPRVSSASDRNLCVSQDSPIASATLRQKEVGRESSPRSRVRLAGFMSCRFGIEDIVHHRMHALTSRLPEIPECLWSRTFGDPPGDSAFNRRFSVMRMHASAQRIFQGFHKSSLPPTDGSSRRRGREPTHLDRQRGSWAGWQLGLDC